MSTPVFRSADQYKQHFIDQLHAIAGEDAIGVYILVLANALSKPEIYTSLADTLKTRFLALKQNLDSASAYAKNASPADDLNVFKKLTEIDISTLPVASKRTLEQWQLQYHPLRSLRPPRNSRQKVSALFQPFVENHFHFNKPFLSREILWQGLLANTPVRIFYNKFPFADYHALLVVNPQDKQPQFLRQQDCHLAQDVLEEMSTLDGVGIAYNSLGAFASVNHQHWQLFLSESIYPVESLQWTHNNGSRNYPVEVNCFTSLREAWPAIDYFQKFDQSFNLLSRPCRTYLVRRRKQGEYLHSDWTSGYAWSEIMGNLMTTRLHDYQSLTCREIVQEFQRLKCES